VSHDIVTKFTFFLLGCIYSKSMSYIICFASLFEVVLSLFSWQRHFLHCVSQMSRVIHQGALLYIARNIKQNKTWAIMIHLLVKENQSWRNYGFSSSCAILCLSFFPSVPAVTSMFPVIELQLPHVFFASSSLSFFAFASL